MISENEFVERWRRYVAGTIALGHASLRVYMVGGAKDKHPAEEVLDKLDSEAIALLKKLYRDLVRTIEVPEPAQPPAMPASRNGVKV